MIQFNELRLTPDNTTLIIDVSVIDLPYYTDIYIDDIIIDSQDTYVSTGPSSTPIYNFVVSSTPSSLYPGYYGNIKNFRKELTISDIPTVVFRDTMFFIYIRVKGTPSIDTPCGMDNITTMGVVVGLYPFYQDTINYLKEIVDPCNIPKKFIDLILRMKALELSIKTGNYIKAIYFWNKFFKQKLDVTIYNCGCDG